MPMESAADGDVGSTADKAESVIIMVVLTLSICMFDCLRQFWCFTTLTPLLVIQLRSAEPLLVSVLPVGRHQAICTYVKISGMISVAYALS